MKLLQIKFRRNEKKKPSFTNKIQKKIKFFQFQMSFTQKMKAIWENIFKKTEIIGKFSILKFKR